MVMSLFHSSKKTTNIHVHIFGGDRVLDGTMGLFHGSKKNDKIHVHIVGGGRVPDGAMILFHSSKKKTTKYMFILLVGVGFQMVP